MIRSRIFFGRIKLDARRRFHILRTKGTVVSRVLRFPIYERIVKRRLTSSKTGQPKFLDSLGFLTDTGFVEFARERAAADFIDQKIGAMANAGIEPDRRCK